MDLLLTIVIVVFLYGLYKHNNRPRYDYQDDYDEPHHDEYSQPLQPNNPIHVVHHQYDVKGKRGRNQLVCPKCRSVNVDILDNSKKGFSVGKAVVGGVLVPGVGALAGFTGKNNKKPTMRCLSCGNVFKFKL